MEVEQIAVEVENVATVEAEKPVADQGAGDAATSHSERLRRKGKKYVRTNSKEGVSTPTPLPKYRSWKNSRRPRNGHGRGLPKKGKPIQLVLTSYNIQTCSYNRLMQEKILESVLRHE